MPSASAAYKPESVALAEYWATRAPFSGVENVLVGRQSLLPSLRERGDLTPGAASRHPTCSKQCPATALGPCSLIGLLVIFPI